MNREEDILEIYCEEIEEFPEEIYDGFLDDDYSDAEERYLENVEFEDIPDVWLEDFYARERYDHEHGVTKYENERKDI